MKYCFQLFSLILTLMIALTCYNFASANNLYTNNRAIVGFLQTKSETYPNELTFSHNITEMLTVLGAEVIRIDYNTIVDFTQIKGLESSTPQVTLPKEESKKIKNIVLKFLQDNKINRILIPGNYYNVDTDPYPPTPNRQLITNALVEIAHENPKIHIMGICGGLQGIMHALGIEIIRVHKIMQSNRSADTHSISNPDPHAKEVALHKLQVIPNSKLASVISKHVTPDENGWLSLYFPDAHGGVINNNKENIDKLKSLGYEVVGFSDSGIIEVIEDTNGNIHFQDHPEGLLINALQDLSILNIDKIKDNVSKDDHRKRYEAALSAIAIMHHFLYRE
ncbi:gamma-glutamyl-gamma-aminobutyrate hydrolase family protein [Neoehrlichia mikurensis]|uniref:Gamma-glutamyl-gamma-aminobutyrate hydrolase family protein n=1 Tax=Neoehrlichia mikurensis TaxID=89586 RepID=A0A9Q9F3C1_9RICK|nr:gamma-glutamyl-gamma-aminobutyrate hydrolase family protein [Neoehrlichia mikurensis]QXK92039.1 gamma-glutamyl-gamma-aminobutyrate hydrolase family protein [Neoehrlichia mikurensis]QXK92497.1 gamma-glutamyl-gamma-aminobutyrate hydrolase family protein [Neoehrlichia mikurensis]QXK93732.1 gamma-glutamyl-gamma-aminobutyrate hydrolase family protein [Neoehrlichia mikurensis]UTO55294.1 gamma-glutamyl-gamma-aminobutyrate hydrolase family protein [Neoehrlichia mikurensis]UTO56214.1 gamma-glutamyl-